MNSLQFTQYFFCTLAIILIIIYPFYMQMVGYNVLIKQIFSNEYKGMESGDPNLIPIIIGWNNFHFFGNVIEVMTGLANVDECSFKCKYTADKNLYPNASAIVFYVRVEYGQLPPQRLPNQLYAFYLDEPPHYTFDLYKNLPFDFFNISMSYRADSDIYFPYDRFVPLNVDSHPDEIWTEKEILERVNNKSKLALQVNSDCVTPSKREKLVEELKNLIEVNLYGDCMNGRKCDWNDDCYNRELESHFFYLAFENNVCRDYVTEKFWNLKHLIVPIVLTRRMMEELPDIPPGSFIAADDFSNGKELADYLVYLRNNLTAYLGYFEWTKHFRKTHYHSLRRILSKKYHQTAIIAKHPATPSEATNPLCALCELLHRQNREGNPRRTIPDIWRWWQGEGVCIENFVDLWKDGKEKEAFKRAKWPTKK